MKIVRYASVLPMRLIKGVLIRVIDKLKHIGQTKARHGRHTGRKSQEEPSVMVVAIPATIRITSNVQMSLNPTQVAQR
jgi:hypothetical protein